MLEDYIIISIVIIILSVVQSVFGIGILIFGTPILLLFGFDFFPALSFLLPASFIISLLQVFTSWDQKPVISKYLYIWCLPAIALSLWITDLTSWSHYLIGGILIASAVTRFNQRIQKWLASALRKNDALYHVLMGIVHGSTNLGGALLTIFAVTVHHEKKAIRYVVAYYYLLFSLVQFFVLAVVVKFPALFSYNLLTALLAVFIFSSIGNRIFIQAKDNTYQKALSIFIFACGLAIILNF